MDLTHEPPDAGPPAHELTPEQIGILAELADSALAGRRLVRAFVWLFGAVGAAAMALYYVMATWHLWGQQPPPPGGH